LSLKYPSFLLYECVLISALIRITSYCTIHSMGLFWENKTVWSSLFTPRPRAFLFRQCDVKCVVGVLLDVTRSPNSPEMCLYPQEQRRCLWQSLYSTLEVKFSLVTVSLLSGLASEYQSVLHFHALLRCHIPRYASGRGLANIHSRVIIDLSSLNQLTISPGHKNYSHWAR
jgi:hypothetical protein